MNNLAGHEVRSSLAIFIVFRPRCQCFYSQSRKQPSFVGSWDTYYPVDPQYSHDLLRAKNQSGLTHKLELTPPNFLVDTYRGCT